MKKSAAEIRFAGSGRERVSASASETVTRDAGSGKGRGGRSQSLFGCIISYYLVLWVCLVREKVVVARFGFIWQLLSNYGVISLKRFVSSFTTKLYN